MKIGELAKLLGIPPSTIRYYEKQGLIDPPKRISGNRDFCSTTVVRLRFIQLAQSAGFTIREIDNLLERYTQESANEDLAKQSLWQNEVSSKQQEIRLQIEELKQADAVLDELMKCRCETIEHCVSQAITDPRWLDIHSE